MVLAELAEGFDCPVMVAEATVTETRLSESDGPLRSGEASTERVA